ncbi:hypothetical protein [Streptomyces chartreusis]
MDLRLLGPARAGAAPELGFKSLRQVTESVNDSFQGELGLE